MHDNVSRHLRYIRIFLLFTLHPAKSSLTVANLSLFRKSLIWHLEQSNRRVAKREFTAQNTCISPCSIVSRLSDKFGWIAKFKKSRTDKGFRSLIRTQKSIPVAFYHIPRTPLPIYAHPRFSTSYNWSPSNITLHTIPLVHSISFNTFVRSTQQLVLFLTLRGFC
ncbi:hypothetical protein VTL71DRAFT_11932 [Oculimacula yallundae]|uniref:Uncharacterized protein n=1 Tax=Oculimacula yallundae TaxID=86028 RepID=A0ABR4CU33_9HELO